MRSIVLSPLNSRRVAIDWLRLPRESGVQMPLLLDIVVGLCICYFICKGMSSHDMYPYVLSFSLTYVTFFSNDIMNGR